MRDYEFIVGPKTSALPMVSNAVNPTDSIRYGQANDEYASRKTWERDVADLAAMKALITQGGSVPFGRVTGQKVYIVGLQKIFRWDAASTLTSDGTNIVRPDDVATDASPGRWLWINFDTNSIQYNELTSNATMSVNTGYITNSSSRLEIKLPPTSSKGDIIEIVGKGSGGWKIVSNEGATGQVIRKQASSSTVNASNVIGLAQSVDRYDSVTMLCISTNEWVMVDGYGTVILANYFGDGSDGTQTISSTTTLTVQNKVGSYDGDMVVKQYQNLTVNAQLIPDQPCRGMYILCTGDLVVNSGGIIDMTGRGANANPAINGGSDVGTVNASGLQFRARTSAGSTSNSATDLLAGCGTLAKTVENNQPPINGDGDILVIPRTGASGGAGVGDHNPGNAGSAGTGGQTGGGGSGSAESGASGAGSGNGGAGTCFAGGSASGGGRTGVSSSADSIAGAGTNGVPTSLCTGGVGNPGGTGTPTQNNGNGGILIIKVKGNVTINSGGIIRANGVTGVTGANAVGGSSGGGSIIIMYGGTYTNSGTVQANGGTAPTGQRNAGAGGNGSIQTLKIVA